MPNGIKCQKAKTISQFPEKNIDEIFWIKNTHLNFISENTTIVNVP